MRRAGFVVVGLAAALLTGCASTDGPTDQEPRSSRHTPAPGTRSVSFHGISVDVPDAAVLTTPDPCGGGLPTTGPLIVPLFDGGATSCPATTGGRTIPARPASALTVLLLEQGTSPDLGLPDPRHQDVTGADVTVVASGPAGQVDAVFASIRPTPQDDHGCADRIDPTVAPSNIESADGSLLPVPTSRIVVCEYATTASATAGGDLTPARPYWLVASDELSDDAMSRTVALIGSASPVEATTTALEPGGPVLRLLVLGSDGNTRTLQAVPDVSPEPVTDGRRTVGVGDDGSPTVRYEPLPTPFDRP